MNEQIVKMIIKLNFKESSCNEKEQNEIRRFIHILMDKYHYIKLDNRVYISRDFRESNLAFKKQNIKQILPNNLSINCYVINNTFILL